MKCYYSLLNCRYEYKIHVLKGSHITFSPTPPFDGGYGDILKTTNFLFHLNKKFVIFRVPPSLPSNGGVRPIVFINIVWVWENVIVTFWEKTFS